MQSVTVVVGLRPYTAKANILPEQTIGPDPEKNAYDIAMPILSPILTRKRALKEEIEALDVSKFKTPRLPQKEGDAAAEEFTYESYDIITLLEHAGHSLSTTEGFPWSRPTLLATKTVFNLVAADNEFEKAFAFFLEKAPDIVRFLITGGRSALGTQGAGFAFPTVAPPMPQ